MAGGLQNSHFPSTPKIRVFFMGGRGMADRILDEYHPLAFYKKHSKAKASGFSKFAVDGKYYFCRYSDGKICMISQAYQSVAGRDNGIVSIRNNEKISGRFKFVEREGGKHGFSLRAGNHQEIAISPDYGTQKAAEFVVGRLTGKTKAKAKSTTKKAASKQPVARQAKASVSKAAAKPKPKPVSKPKPKSKPKTAEQDYRPLAFYQRQTKGLDRGIEAFTGDDGKHYFAYFENGKIAMISEGYPTTTARDTGIASVEKNIGLEPRYNYRGPLKNGKYEYRLKAGNHKEIARSVWYGSAAAATTGAAYLIGTRKRVAKLAPKTAAPIAAVAAAPLAAAALVGQKAAASTPPVEAPAKPVVREPVTKSEITPPVETALPSYDGEGGGIWRWLKWLLLLLAALFALFFLLKACSGEKKTPVAAVTTVSCWDGSEAASQSACPTKVTCWNGEFATSRSACPVEPAPEPKIVEPAKPTPTFSCWDNSVVTDLANCPVKPAPTPEPVPERVPAPAVTPAPSRTTYSRDRGITAGIFAAGATPVLVKRLGTNPEFGDSRALSANGFYDKLNNRYFTNSFDRKYLDYLAKELGYGGWSEVTAADFSEAVLSNGTKGVLGYGSFHGYQYAQFGLVDANQLEAFQIASRNGRTVYFMKACGNYFYPTE